MHGSGTLPRNLILGSRKRHAFLSHAECWNWLGRRLLYNPNDRMHPNPVDVGGGEDFPYSRDDNQPNPSVAKRLQRFKQALVKLPAADVVWKHVLQGDCYILDEDSHYELQSRISQQFNIDPDRVRVVGSGKLGFSIVADKRYRPFARTSDIDVAIISDVLFDRIWLDVVAYDAKALSWPERKRKFRKYLFNGWIRPDALPDSEHFPTTREWWKFFKELSGALRGGQFRINGGLYRTVEFLQRYQLRSVAECRTSLELNA